MRRKLFKKIFKIICTTLILSLLLTFPAGAATKSEVMETLRRTVLGNYINIDPENIEVTGKPIGEYIFVLYMAENAVRNYNFTAAQGDLFNQWILDCAAYVNTDYGPSAHDYTRSQQQFVIERLFRVANEMNFRLEFVNKARPVHLGDQIFNVYDRSTGELVFQYDGDLVKRTGE
ncbi:MAG TPA: hypothetical protein DEQ02_03260 [Ruminococcaceae bacterium]|nr:hypothetical protein [Oscillospiraceae bacterium]